MKYLLSYLLPCLVVLAQGESVNDFATKHGVSIESTALTSLAREVEVKKDKSLMEKTTWQLALKVAKKDTKDEVARHIRLVDQFLSDEIALFTELFSEREGERLYYVKLVKVDNRHVDGIGYLLLDSSERVVTAYITLPGKGFEYILRREESALEPSGGQDTKSTDNATKSEAEEASL